MEQVFKTTIVKIYTPDSNGVRRVALALADGTEFPEQLEGCACETPIRASALIPSDYKCLAFVPPFQVKGLGIKADLKITLRKKGDPVMRRGVQVLDKTTEEPKFYTKDSYDYTIVDGTVELTPKADNALSIAYEKELKMEAELKAFKKAAPAGLPAEEE